MNVVMLQSSRDMEVTANKRDARNDIENEFLPLEKESEQTSKENEIFKEEKK